MADLPPDQAPEPEPPAATDRPAPWPMPEAGGEPANPLAGPAVNGTGDPTAMAAGAPVGPDAEQAAMDAATADAHRLQNIDGMVLAIDRRTQEMTTELRNQAGHLIVLTVMVFLLGGMIYVAARRGAKLDAGTGGGGGAA